MLPDFFIGGAQKSGTTSLHVLLQQHQEVFIPRRPQEIHFFDREESWARGRDWYESLFGQWRGEKRVGQTSPLILYQPEAGERIARLVPQARFLFILRHPLDRAYAHYWHEVKKGWESLPFERALAAEPERLRGGPEARRHYSYLDRGRYAAQLRRFFERFSRERVLVLRYEELRSDAAGLRVRCAAFLEVDPAGFAPATARVHNPSRIPRLRALQVATRGLRERWPRAGRLVDALNLKTAPYPPLDSELRARFSRGLEPELDALERLLGIDLSDWRGAGARC